MGAEQTKDAYDKGIAMFVLVVGHRRGITKALEKINISFIVWSNKKIKTKISALSIIESPFPKEKEDLEQWIPAYQNLNISHVIAGSEEAVLPASKLRIWLDARRNPHSLIIRCTDKLKMKEYLVKDNIPMTDFMDVRKVKDPKDVFARLGCPVIAKPRKSSGGRGIELIEDDSKIVPKIKEEIILEKKILGTEGSVESLIHKGQILFTNITGYQQLGHCNLVPGLFPDYLVKQILELNKNVISSLKIKWGLTHLEFYQTDEKILFGEIALRPPGGYIMEALELAYNKNFWDLYVRIELDMDFELPEGEHNYAASIVIHPPPGRVKKIRGLDNLNSIESIQKFKLKVKEGQVITERLGVGQDYGHLLLKNSDSNKLLNDIERFNQTIDIEM